MSSVTTKTGDSTWWQGTSKNVGQGLIKRETLEGFLEFLYKDKLFGTGDLVHRLAERN